MRIGHGLSELAAVVAAMLLPVGIASASETDEGTSEAIRVHGDIEQHCQIDALKSVDLGDLQRSNISADLRFGLNCNTPFVLQIRASNGALTNIALPNGDGPYSGKLPYSIALALPVRHPAISVIARTFSSTSLQGGQQISSQGGIATDGFVLSLVGGQPGGSAGLLAGDYSETITLTISVI